MSKSNKTVRHRVGRVSYYQHHGAWWVYFRKNGKPVRRRIDGVESDAEREAARINAVLCGAIAELPPPVNPLAVASPADAANLAEVIAPAELQQRFLEHHESIKRSALSTVKRYRAATTHYVEFKEQRRKGQGSPESTVHEFVLFLRKRFVSPNGHPHSAKRQLRDKGVRYILQVCRSMYRYAFQAGLLPAGVANPFDAISIDSLRVEDAKSIFVFDAVSELEFLKAADDWTFAIHFVLAKTGMRPGELVHLFIEEVDFENGRIHIRNKPELGWQVKTRSERSVPMIPALQQVLQRVIGDRQAGPVFLRRRFEAEVPTLIGGRVELARELESRLKSAAVTSREQLQRIALTVWRDAGAVKVDQVRSSFVKTCVAIDLPQSTCPKSWRHTLATLLQDANVDPLVRQTILGHKASSGSGPLGMTGVYTHTRPETIRASLIRATELWQDTLTFASERITQEGAEHDAA